MNPLQLMNQKKESFTPNELQIYENIIQDPGSIARLTTSMLAEYCNVSQAAITRFVKSLGYEKYQDFRNDMIYYLSMEAQEQTSTDSSPFFHSLKNMINEAEKVLTPEYIVELASYINSFRRIYVTGVSKSYQPAELFEILSRRFRHSVHAVRYDFIEELSDCLNEDDLFIIFSVSGQSFEKQLHSMEKAKKLLITCNPFHGKDHLVDKTVVLPYGNGNPEIGLASPILFDIFIELIVSYMIKIKRD